MKFDVHLQKRLNAIGEPNTQKTREVSQPLKWDHEIGDKKIMGANTKIETSISPIMIIY
jgi:hypothetical protein